MHFFARFAFFKKVNTGIFPAVIPFKQVFRSPV